MREKQVLTDSGSRHYTLIELLLVIGIMMVILGASFPAFTKIMNAQAIPSSVRMISSEMHLARAYAIEQRKYVAVAFYRTNDAPRRYGFRPFIVVKDSSNYYQIKDYVPTEDWQFLPTGATFGVNTGATGATSMLDTTNTTCSMQGYYARGVTGSHFSNAFGGITYGNPNYCFYVYKPTGQLDTNGVNWINSAKDPIISLRKTSTATNDDASTNPDKKDKKIYINQFTGRVYFEEQQ